MNSEVIIDIETLGTKANSVILTIGAIKFKRFEELKELSKYDTFYIRINTESCKKKGLEVDKETVKWWNEQPKLVRYESVFHPDRCNLEEGLNLLSDFVKGSRCIWSQGSFDSIILNNAYEKCGIEIPWKFWEIRDSRTLFDVMQIDLKSIEYKNEEVHNALVDCYRQLMATVKSFKKIKNI